MPFYHARRCGGDISLIRMRCKKCHKQWNPVSFFLDPYNIRHYTNPDKRPTTYAKWGNKVPGVGEIASMLPNWPRWARLLTLVPIVSGLALIVYLILMAFGRVDWIF